MVEGGRDGGRGRRDEWKTSVGGLAPELAGYGLPSMDRNTPRVAYNMASSLLKSGTPFPALWMLMSDISTPSA